RFAPAWPPAAWPGNRSSPPAPCRPARPAPCPSRPHPKFAPCQVRRRPPLCAQNTRGRHMTTPPEGASALITNDAVGLGLLAAILGLVFCASSLNHPWVPRCFAVIPALLLCYFLPSLLTTFGVVDPEQSRLYFIASRFLLPAALVLLTVSADLPAVLGLGPKALIMFFTGTLGVMLGGPIALLLTSWIAPDLLGAGPEAIWRGMATVAGSWIGGSANQTALYEIFGAGPDMFSIWIAVDVMVANVWMAVLLWIAANQRRVDRLFRADAGAVDRVRDKAEAYEAEY